MRIVRFGVYLSRSGAIKVQKQRMNLLINGQNAMLPEDGEQAQQAARERLLKCPRRTRSHYFVLQRRSKRTPLKCVCFSECRWTGVCPSARRRLVRTRVQTFPRPRGPLESTEQRKSLCFLLFREIKNVTCNVHRIACGDVSIVCVNVTIFGD